MTQWMTPSEEEEDLEEWPWLTDEILSHHYVYINNEDSAHSDRDSHQYKETNMYSTKKTVGMTLILISIINEPLQSKYTLVV